MTILTDISVNGDGVPVVHDSQGRRRATVTVSNNPAVGMRYVLTLYTSDGIPMRPRFFSNRNKALGRAIEEVLDMMGVE